MRAFLSTYELRIIIISDFSSIIHPIMARTKSSVMSRPFIGTGGPGKNGEGRQVQTEVSDEDSELVDDVEALDANSEEEVFDRYSIICWLQLVCIIFHSGCPKSIPMARTRREERVRV